MKEFKHVFRMGPKYVFRLSLPGHRFCSREHFDSAEDAAFYSDVFKAYLASTYRLTGVSLSRSLAPSRFTAILQEAGFGPADDTSPLLPESCREYLELCGHESITAYLANEAELKKAKRFDPPTQ